MSHLVSVRLLFINEHQEIDRIDLPSSGAKVYGRPGNPLRLDYSELGGPPPAAQCRIRAEEGGWFLENIGAEGQTRVNNQLVKGRVALQDWAEIRCGTQLVRFESCGSRHGAGELAALRDQLLAANKAAEEAQKALTRSAAEREQAAAKAEAAEVVVNQHSDSNAALRRQLSSAAQQYDSLRERFEQKEREHTTQRNLLIGENQQLKKDRVQDAAHLARLDKENQAAQNAANATIAKATEGELAARKLQQQVTELKLQLEQSQQVQTKLYEENKTLGDDHARLARVADAAERSAREARQSRATVEKEIRELRDLRDKHLEENKEYDALRLQAARARQRLADCQAKLQRQLVESAATSLAAMPLERDTASMFSEPVRQVLKALDRAIVNVNYAVHSCEEKWNRTDFTGAAQRHDLLSELRQISSATSAACTFLDQLHRLMPTS